MTEPTDRTPRSPDPDDARVSEILASLAPSEQAMPPELAARIEASLAQEHARRSPGAPVVPLATRRRRSIGPWILGAAAAAVLAVAVPTVLRDVMPLQGGNDSAGAPEAVSGSSVTEDASGGSAADGVGPGSATSAPPSQTGSATSRGGSMTKGATPFVLTISERRYTEASLAEDARRVTSADSRREQAAGGFQASESPMHGPLTTEIGARDCLVSLGASPTVRPTQTDVGTFDGDPGFLLVAEDGPTGDRVTRAWAVAAGCEPIYDEPVELR